MTTRHRPQPPAHARQLAAVAGLLTGRHVTIRHTRIGGTPVLTITGPAGSPNPATISIDPDPASPGSPVECTCIWTPGPGTTPDAIAGTIIAVLDAVRPRTATHPPGTGDPAR